MNLAQRLTRRIEIPAGGKLWRIVFSHDVLLDIEDLTGLDVWAGGVNLDRPSAKLLRAVLYAALHHAGSDLSLKDAGEMLRLGKMSELRVKLMEAWGESMPEPEEDEADGKAPRILTWSHAWAIAGQDLGLSDEKWLAMTPRMLQALTRQRLERLQREEILVGTIAAAVSNSGFRAPERTVSAEMYMLHPFKTTNRPTEMNPQGQTGEDVLSAFSPWMDEESKKVTGEVLKTKS